MRCIVTLFLVAVAATAGRADEVRLKNGSTFEGRIVKEDDATVVIDFGDGRMTFQKKDIVTITRTPPKEPAAPPGSPDKKAAPAPAPAKKTTTSPDRPTASPRPPQERPPRGAQHQKSSEAEPPLEKETGRIGDASAPLPLEGEKRKPAPERPANPRHHPASRPSPKPDW